MECYNDLSMSMKFPLIKHDSMGDGVVINHETANILEVGFVHDGVKKITKDNVFISPSKMNVIEFIDNELYEYLFDNYTKSKAKNYISPLKMSSLEIEDNKISGIIYGTEPYSFSIRSRDSAIYFDCSCPVVGLCKHLYAVCAFIKKNYSKTDNHNYKQEKDSQIIRRQIENYLYYNVDTTNYRFLFGIYDYVKIATDLEPFYKEAFSFYNRNQYHNKMIDMLLYPLTFDPELKDSFQTYIKEGDNQNIVNMLLDVLAFEESTLYLKASKNKIHRQRDLLLKMVFEQNLDYFFALEDVSERESPAVAQCLCRFLSTNELNLENITKISEDHNFQFASRYVYGIFITYKNMPENNKLLFLDQLGNVDNILRDCPIDYLMSQIKNSSNPMKFFTILDERFSEIQKESYPDVVGAICFAALTHNYWQEKDKDAIMSIVSKLDDNKYVLDLVATNMRNKNVWRY